MLRPELSRTRRSGRLRGLTVDTGELPRRRGRRTATQSTSPPLVLEEYELEEGPLCQGNSPLSRCPVKLDRRAGAYVLKADLVKVNIEGRRRAEATEEWRSGRLTNSELNKGAACRLPKALACNFKWSMHAWWSAAQPEAGTVPAVAAAWESSMLAGHPACQRSVKGGEGSRQPVAPPSFAAPRAPSNIIKLPTSSTRKSDSSPRPHLVISIILWSPENTM